MRIRWMQLTCEQGPGSTATVQIFKSVHLPVESAHSPFGNTARGGVLGSRCCAASLRATDSLITNVCLEVRAQLFNEKLIFMKSVVKTTTGALWHHQIHVHVIQYIDSKNRKRASVCPHLKFQWLIYYSEKFHIYTCVCVCVCVCVFNLWIHNMKIQHFRNVVMRFKIGTLWLIKDNGELGFSLFLPVYACKQIYSCASNNLWLKL